MNNPNSTTPVSKFGKDHWSLLAYVECCCVDGVEGVGKLALNRVRCNPETHPLMSSGHAAWKLNYSTRLAGFFDFADRADPAQAIAEGLQLSGHDDWDCLDDLEALGYVEVLSMANGRVKLTPLGTEVAAALRAFKSGGGQFAGFRLPQGEHGMPTACAQTPSSVIRSDKEIPA